MSVFSSLRDTCYHGLKLVCYTKNKSGHDSSGTYEFNYLTISWMNEKYTESYMNSRGNQILDHRM